MQRYVKIGIAIGVLLIVLIAIFWWARGNDGTQLAQTEGEERVEGLPPTQEPGPSEGVSAVLPYESMGDRVPNAPGPIAEPGPPSVTPPEPVRNDPTVPVRWPRRHTIQSGDNFSRLAVHYYGNESKRTLIRRANPGIDPLRLQIGQKILIPYEEEDPALLPVNMGTRPPVGDRSPTASREQVHTVAANENLTVIARKYYGTATPADIDRIYRANANKMADRDMVTVGMKLIIPPKQP